MGHELLSISSIKTLNREAMAQNQYMPDRFRSGKKQRFRASQMLRTKDFMTFQASVLSPYLHTLSASDVGISKEHSLPSCLYETQSISIWREAIKSIFRGVLFYCLEIGRGDFNSPKRGPLHCHVLAAHNDGLGPKFVNTQKLKKVDDLKNMMIYLAKPSESYSLEAWLDWKSAKLISEGKKSPRLKGWLTSKNRRAWCVANALGDSIENQGVL